MLSVDDALRLVLGEARPLVATNAPCAAALGLTLADDVASDVDSPPHDKAIVDGYAVRAADLAGGTAELTVLEEVVAGAIPSQAVTPGGCTRIMTGAPIPVGADAVVMVERTQLAGRKPERVRVDDPRLTVGQNITRRGTSMQRGEIVLRAGRQIRAVELGLLAEVGRTSVGVVPRPRVAVLATGNELVTASETPGPGQIRNSNEPLLVACVARAGGEPRSLGIARDDRAMLRQAIHDGLTADVLVLSGGVSAGVLDLVPSVLAELGVEQVFHKVRIKPGKPLWFGKYQGGGHRALVFGLPGNPVSGLVCCEIFVRPALAALAARGTRPSAHVCARLTQPFTQRGDRAAYHPVRLERSGESYIATPVNWHGSGDLRGLAEADALAIFPPGDRLYETSTPVECLRLE